MTGMGRVFVLLRPKIYSAVFSLFICAINASAQTTNASIYGSVLDSSGAAVTKASVIAHDVKTGVNSATVTNDSGVYIFPSLQPGEYSVTAESAGFRKAASEHIQLEVGSKISINLSLEALTGLNRRGFALHTVN